MKEIHIVYLDDIESLIINKYFLEQKLIDEEIIEKKMTLQEFMSDFVHISDNVIFYDILSGQPDVFPFYIYNDLPDDTYVFFATANEHIDEIVNEFKKIDFDMTKLKKYDNAKTLVRLKNIEYMF